MPDRRILAAALLLAGTAAAQDRMVVGYVLDRPLPELALHRADWLAFDSDAALFDALQQGRVQLATGLAFDAPFQPVDDPVPLRLVDIAALRPDTTSCFLAQAIADTGASGNMLNGLRVAVASGSPAELAFETQMRKLGADPYSAIRFDLATPDAASALGLGEADIACGSGPDLDKMHDHGIELASANDNFALGLRWFTGTFVTSAAASRHAAEIRDFVLRANHAETTLDVLARAADMPLAAAEAANAALLPLDADEKLSDRWFGRDLADFLAAYASMLQHQGRISADPVGRALILNPQFLDLASRQ